MNFFQALTLLFIGLKLTDVIDWSWVLVLAPYFLPLLYSLGVIAFVGFVYGWDKIKITSKS